MPKLKSHSGAKKRFNLTKTGKVRLNLFLAPLWLFRFGIIDYSFRVFVLGGRPTSLFGARLN